jgi:hypothetical protein
MSYVTEGQGAVRAAVGLLVVLSAACSTVRVKTDFNERVNFTQYRTFEVAACQTSGTTCSAEGSLLEDRIAGALTGELRARGLEADPVRPDLLVAFTVMTFTKGDLIQPGGFPPWGGLGGDIWSDDIRQATLVVNVIDARSHCTLWSARAQTEQPDFTSTPVIRQTVARALESYPRPPRLAAR